MKIIKIFLLFFFLFTTTSLFANELNGLVKNQGETFNFELAGQKNWDYDLKRIKDKKQTKIQLFVKAEEGQLNLNKIKNIDNPFVQSINVKGPQDGKWIIEFILKNENVDTFDYLTDQPSKLIVDFYVNDNQQEVTTLKVDLPEVKKNKKAKIISAKNSKKYLNAKNDKKRKPAEADYLQIDQPGGIETSALLKSGLSDGADAYFDRFIIRDIEINEKSILKSDSNYYLKFPMLEMDFLFWNAMKMNPPLYQFQENKSDENKLAQLLKTLFDKKRFLVFGKTAEWFEKKYKASKYLESIAFMKGDALIELWRQEKNDKLYELGQFAYSQALEKYPQSALAERTSLMLGLLALDKMDYMTAIRRFHIHIENNNFKNRISNEYARLGLGFSYSKINKLAGAINEMNNLEKESKNPLVQAEAAFRRADFNFDSKKFDSAIEAYNLALTKYPTLAHLFPNTQFNKMESYFWRKQYPEAHQAGLEFARKFPSHPYAPYALTRVGELLDILGADQSRSVGAFLETYFRYGDSPKTIIARLHLLSTRMKSMKEEELKQTIAKMEELSQKSELINIDQFKVTMIADGFTRRADYEKAIDILSNFFQKNPNRSDSKQVTKRIVRNIFDQIRNFSDNGQYKEVLKTYQKYSDTWLKHQNRIDTDFLLGLAYENAGDYNVALEKYSKTLQNMQSIKGTEKEKWLAVAENLPSEDHLNLRLASCDFQIKNYQKSFEQLEKIKEPYLLSQSDQVLRVQLASELYEKKGDVDTALRYLTELIRVWNGKPELTVDALLRIAEMQDKKNKPEESQKNLEKIFEIAEKNLKANPRSVIKAANMSANLYLKEDKLNEAAKKYSFILEKYEDSQKMAEERFKLGDIYFKKGELKKAEAIWSKLKGENASVWFKIGENKLKDAQWKDEYRKYLKRIPAMSQLEVQE